MSEKVEAIKAVENGCLHRQVANDLNVGRTQINNIIKNKTSIMEAYKSGINGSNRYLAPRYLPNTDIDKQVWSYFCQMRLKGVPTTGPMLQSETQTIALTLGHDENFLASNGWLRSFCSRHQIKHANLHGKSAEVDQNVCTDWRQNILPRIIEGYHLSDILNCDKTAVFFCAVNNKSFILPGEAPKGVKALKERVSILLTCSAKGKKLPTLIIGKSAKPWSFLKDTTDLL